MNCLVRKLPIHELACRRKVQLPVECYHGKLGNYQACPLRITAKRTGTRFRDFSLLGIFAPRSERSHWELSLSRTEVPGNFCSREWMFLGKFVPWSNNTRSELYE